MAKNLIQSGVSTEALNQIAHDYIVNVQGCIPAPLNYNGFPKSICTSINHVVCHGIPDEKKILKNGDIINIDVTVIKDGYYGDTSKMWIIGEGSWRYFKDVDHWRWVDYGTTFVRCSSKGSVCRYECGKKWCVCRRYWCGD